MLGVTSYQEALRTLGAMLEGSAEVAVQEIPESAVVCVRRGHERQELGADELRRIVLASRARRGQIAAQPERQQPPGPLADLLRAVGFALDDLHAVRIELEVGADALVVRFRDRNLRPRELAYAADEIVALREAAALRRNGDPLSRVLILHDDPEAVAPLRELLVAEFAVQVLPGLYAPAVAQSGEPPDAVLARAEALMREVEA
jgi:hypothetical protein